MSLSTSRHNGSAKTRIQLHSAADARNWVDQLPVADMGSVTKQLFSGLLELNQQLLKPAVRIEITEILLPYIRMALENLDRHFMSRSFPLPERSQKMFALKQSLMMEAAGSYQLAALEMITKQAGSKKILLTAVGRAMSLLTQTILDGFEIYAKPQKNIWHDINHLYLIASEQGIHKKEVIDKNDSDAKPSSIEDDFKLTNLIALTGANALRQGELTRLKSFYRAVLNEVVIHSDADKVKSKYAHVALLNGDEHASLMPLSEIVSSPTTRIFDLSRIVYRFDQFIEQCESAYLGTHDSYPMLSHSLAKRAAHNLTTIRNRRYKRFARDESGSLVFRLAKVIELLDAMEEDSFLAQINDESEDETVFSELMGGDSVSSPWSEVDVDSLVEDIDVDVYSWQIDNSSTGGYGLSQTLDESSNARVGELVAIKDPSDHSGNWQIATIRWMDYIKTKGLSMGLQVLSLTGQRMTAETIVNREVTHKFPIEGVYLPKIEGVREEVSAIFPNYVFRSGDIVRVLLEGKEKKIEINQVDDTLGTFTYCTFDDVGEERVEENNVDAYDDVWDFI